MRTKRMARQAGEGWSHLTSKQLFADIQVAIAQVFGGGEGIEEGRGLCECKSSQKVTKIIRMALRVFSWRLLKGRELGVTKKCRLSKLTNSALVFEPKCGGKGGGCCTQEPK